MKPNPTPIAPSPSTPSQAPAPSALSARDLESPASALLTTFQVDFAQKLPGLDPMASSTRAILEQYAILQQAALAERLSNMLQVEPSGSTLEYKLIRLLLNCLTTQERTAARRSREKAARQREARRQAKEVAVQFRQDQETKNAQRAAEDLERRANLERAGAIETESKDATPPIDSHESSSTSSSPHTATPPAQIHDVASPSLLTTAASDSDRHIATLPQSILV